MRKDRAWWSGFPVFIGCEIGIGIKGALVFLATYIAASDTLRFYFLNGLPHPLICPDKNPPSLKYYDGRFPRPMPFVQPMAAAWFFSSLSLSKTLPVRCEGFMVDSQPGGHI
jgi:hypothetical protein